MFERIRNTYLMLHILLITGVILVMCVVSVSPHAVRAYIVSRDTAVNMFYPHGVCSRTILHLATRIADYTKKTEARQEKVCEIHGLQDLEAPKRRQI